MLAEVARAVFGHVGCPAEATGELTARGARRAVIETTMAERPCDVRFEATSRRAPDAGVVRRRRRVARRRRAVCHDRACASTTR